MNYNKKHLCQILRKDLNYKSYNFFPYSWLLSSNNMTPSCFVQIGGGEKIYEITLNIFLEQDIFNLI